MQVPKALIAQVLNIASVSLTLQTQSFNTAWSAWKEQQKESWGENCEIIQHEILTLLKRKHAKGIWLKQK